MDDTTPDSSLQSPAPGHGLSNGTGDADRHYWYRIAMALAAMVVVNVQQLFLGGRPYGAVVVGGCGNVAYECVGWPLAFLTIYGPAELNYFDPLHLLGDIVIAVVIAHAAARALKNGLPALIHHLRTWGIKDAG